MISSQQTDNRAMPNEVHYFRVHVLAILSCFGSWMFGYNVGVIGGTIVLPAFHSDFNLPEVGTTSYNTIVSNIISLFQIGGLCGAMFTFPATKYLGRTVALSITAAIYFVGAALQTFSHGKLDMMYTGRLITGLGAGGATVVVPLYIAELSPPAIRGSLVGIYEINNQVSSLMGYWCNYIVNRYVPTSESRQWQIPLAMQMIPSLLLFLVATFVLPESPRFLAKRGKKAQALKTLAFIRHLPAEHEDIQGELQGIQDAIERQELSTVAASRFGLIKELGWKGNRNRVAIGLLLMFGQNLTGINAINFYTPTIFKSIGFTGTEILLLASGMYAVVKTVATILSLIFFIDRTGRRNLLLISSVGTSAALWYIGGFVAASNIDLTTVQAKSPAGWVAIVCVYVYAAFFSVAWNGVVWVYCSEIFPPRIKELAVCITTAAQWLSQFAVARGAPFMLESMHGGFFFFFAGGMVVMGIMVFFFVPETKGQTLEKMDEIFGTPYNGSPTLIVENFKQDAEMKGGIIDRSVRESGNCGSGEISRIQMQN